MYDIIVDSPTGHLNFYAKSISKGAQNPLISLTEKPAEDSVLYGQ